MRKWLNVEKKKWFSYNHLNEKHKKLDWMIRITFLLLLLISFFYNVTQDPFDRIWYLETHILLFVFIIASETVRAVMEKRYADNRNDYKFTISQLAFIALSILLFYTTNFFGLLN